VAEQCVCGRSSATIQFWLLLSSLWSEDDAKTFGKPLVIRSFRANVLPPKTGTKETTNCWISPLRKPMLGL